jgi:broad specificity phosphatase PhoE
MKKVFVLRHADKNKATGQLTDEGRKRAILLKDQLGKFNIVITSDRPRTIETAILLSNTQPIIDKRAGFVYSNDEEKEKLSKLAKLHPLNHAGVIFDNLNEWQKLALIIGKNLVELIKETMNKLPKDSQALIISQDGVMIAAEKLLENTGFKKQDKYFNPLEGYIVNENFQIEKLIN